GTSTYDATADVNDAFASAKQVVLPPSGRCMVDYLSIPHTLQSIVGSSKINFTFKRRSGATGAMWQRASDTRNIQFHFSGINLEGNGEDGETCGFDITAFSYG